MNRNHRTARCKSPQDVIRDARRHPAFRVKGAKGYRDTYTALVQSADYTSTGTDPRGRQRLGGRVLASVEWLADECGINEKTARLNLRWLSDHELIVLWSEKNATMGRAREWIVVALAEPETLERARRRAVERAERSAARKAERARPRPRPVRGSDGRWATGQQCPLDQRTTQVTPHAHRASSPESHRASSPDLTGQHVLHNQSDLSLSDLSLSDDIRAQPLKRQTPDFLSEVLLSALQEQGVNSIARGALIGCARTIEGIEGVEDHLGEIARRAAVLLAHGVCTSANVLREVVDEMFGIYGLEYATVASGDRYMGDDLAVRRERRREMQQAMRPLLEMDDDRDDPSTGARPARRAL